MVTHHITWESALKLVGSVARDNFGLCVDAFHLMTKLWADPFVPSGKYPEADSVLRESLRRLLRDCPLEMIVFVQLSDSEKFEPPFSKEHPWYLDCEAL